MQWVFAVNCWTMRLPCCFTPLSFSNALLPFCRCKNYRAVFTHLFLVLLIFRAKAQTDSLMLSQPIYKMYAAQIGGAAFVYNGAEYEGAFPNVLGTPFWNGADFRKGAIGYNGVLYPDVLMAYDLVRGEVVIKGFQQLSLRLEKSRINFFLLDGHRFVQLMGNNEMPDDFYDLLYAGTTNLFARRTKRIGKALQADQRDSIVSNNEYYWQQNDVIFPVNTEGDLRKHLGEKHKAVERFWKEAGLRFKKDPETFLIQTIRFWETQKN